VHFDWELATEENNGKGITEFGFAIANDMPFSAGVRANSINKTSDIGIEGH
jgi:hypothetical protein